MPNVFDDDWQMEMDEAPFRVKGTQVGARAGAEKLGAAVYEIAPGGRVSPLHVHR